MSEKTLFAVVLAGGSGSRFGSPKQLARIGERPMVAIAMSTAEAVCGPRSLLVAGSEWAAVVDAAHTREGFFVVNTHHSSGLSASIAAGVRSIRQQADAVMLLLADQPLVSPDYLRNLESTWRSAPDSIVASKYAGTSGPPVIFPARFFEELLALDGDKGAKAVISAHQADVIEIGCENAAVDVDTPADLARIQPDTASG